jgi:hypothetical protein
MTDAALVVAFPHCPLRPLLAPGLREQATSKKRATEAAASDAPPANGDDVTDPGSPQASGGAAPAADAPPNGAPDAFAVLRQVCVSVRTCVCVCVCVRACTCACACMCV